MPIVNLKFTGSAPCLPLMGN